MTTLTSVELGASGRYIDLGAPSALANLGDLTMLAYCRPTSSENNLAYLLGKGGTSGFGPRMYNQGFRNVGFGSYTSSNGPNRACTNSSFTYGNWMHQAITFDGSANASGIATYLGEGVDLAEITGTNVFTNGSGSVIDDSSIKMTLLNREGLGRSFIGDLAYLAIWDRVLTLTELQTAQNSGPLDVPTGLVLLWANQQDLGPNALTPVSRSTFVAGSLPPNTALGSGATAVNFSGDAAAAATATGTLDVSSPASLSGDAAATAAAAGTLDKTATLAGDAQAQASAAGTVGEPTLSSPENGTLFLAGCSIAPNGLTPTITLANRWVGEANTNGWRSMYGSVSGINGMTPAFRLSKTDMDTSLSVTKKPVFSYDGSTWFAADTLSSDSSYIYFSCSFAFSEDTVYFSLQKPWHIADTLPWIQSLESSGYVSEPPSSSGNNYVFATRSSTLNELGEAVASCPLYSFKISNGAGSAPDGAARRKVILLAGVHPSEDVANYVLKGAVDFLLSSDAQAIIARSWFDFLVYPMVSSAGRRGGTARSDLQTGYITADANRVWAVTTHETVVAHEAAWALDCGSDVPVHIDYHGNFSNSAPYTYVHLGSDKTTWTNALDVYRSGVVSTDMNNSTNTSKWAYDNLSTIFAISPEFPAYSATYSNDPEAWGADTMRALSDIASAGYWQSTIVDLAGAGIVVATSSGAISIGIPLMASAQSQAAASGDLTALGSALLAGNATATASAGGTLSLVIPLSATAVAQALAAAGLAHDTPLAGDAAAQGTADGMLTLNVSLAGNAIAQAAANAGLTAVSASSLAASAAAQATANGALTHAVPLTGAAVTLAAAGANITHIVPVTGAAAGASFATGGLDVSVSLQADALVQALASAGLDVQANTGLLGNAGAQASADGTLTLRINLDGQGVAQAAAMGALASNGLIVSGTPGYAVARTARSWRIAA